MAPRLACVTWIHVASFRLGVCISPRHIAASVFASCQVTRSLFIRWTCRSILSRSRQCSVCARRCPLRLWLSSSWSSMIFICNHSLQHAALELVVSCVIESWVTNLAKLLHALSGYVQRCPRCGPYPLNFNIDTWGDNLCFMALNDISGKLEYWGQTTKCLETIYLPTSPSVFMSIVLPVQTQ